MKTELLLDHATILANQARPIHFALRFTTGGSRSTQLFPTVQELVFDSSAMERE